MEAQSKTELVLTICSYKERQEHGITVDQLKALQEYLRKAKLCQDEACAALLKEENWEPGGRVMFSATLKVPHALAPLANVLKDTISDALATHETFKIIRVGFPRTSSQRERGKVIGMCCNWSEERFKHKFGGQPGIATKYNPNRVAITWGVNELTAIKLTQDFTAAKVTYEAAESLTQDLQKLQVDLDSWLE